MTRDLSKIAEIYEQLYSVAATKRPQLLEELCAGDEGLRRQVELLLANDSRPGVLDNPPALAPFGADDVLANRFEIIRVLGHGGMGFVYEATDHLANHSANRIALKTIVPQLAALPEYRRRFLREINIAKELSHPNICRVHDVHVHPVGQSTDFRHLEPGSTLFLTMEMIHGVTLSEWLLKRGPIATHQAINIADQLTSALAVAHGKGIVHRDFKPGNIMIVERDDMTVRAVITDFGLAHRMLESRGLTPDVSSTLTAPGSVVGTVEYMAPEQLAGEEATPQTDIYALGLILHEMVTGVRPFPNLAGISAAVRRMHDVIPAPSSKMPGLNSHWDSTILGCLKPSPKDRFGSVREVSECLKGSRRARRLMMYAVVLIAVFLVAAVGATLLSRVSFRAKSSSLNTGLTHDAAAYASYLQGKELFDNRQLDSQSDLENVIRQYDLAIERDPQFAAAIARRAYAYLWVSRLRRSEQGSWKDRADFEIKHAADINPDLFEVHLIRGSILTDQAKDQRGLEEARNQLDVALKLSPNSDEVYKKLSTVYRKLGDYPRALEAAESAARSNPNFFDNYLAVAFVAMKMCKVEKAKTAYEKITELAPERPEGWNGLGGVMLLQGNFLRSIEAFKKALEKRKAPAPQSNLALSYFYLGLYPDAVTAAKTAIELDPNRSSSHGNLADNYREMGKTHLALQTYETAIALAYRDLKRDSNNVDAIVNLALYYARTGRSQQAREQLSKVTGHIAVRPDLAYNAALVHVLLHDRDQAIELLQSALSSCNTSAAMAMREPDLRVMNDNPAFRSLIRSFSSPVAAKH